MNKGSRLCVVNVQALPARLVHTGCHHVQLISSYRGTAEHHSGWTLDRVFHLEDGFAV